MHNVSYQPLPPHLSHTWITRINGTSGHDTVLLSSALFIQWTGSSPAFNSRAPVEPRWLCFWAFGRAAKPAASNRRRSASHTTSKALPHKQTASITSAVMRCDWRLELWPSDCRRCCSCSSCSSCCCCCCCIWAAVRPIWWGIISLVCTELSDVGAFFEFLAMARRWLVIIGNGDGFWWCLVLMPWVVELLGVKVVVVVFVVGVVGVVDVVASMANEVSIVSGRALNIRSFSWKYYIFKFTALFSKSALYYNPPSHLALARHLHMINCRRPQRQLHVWHVCQQISHQATPQNVPRDQTMSSSPMPNRGRRHWPAPTNIRTDQRTIARQCVDVQLNGRQRKRLGTTNIGAGLGKAAAIADGILWTTRWQSIHMWLGNGNCIVFECRAAV